ncbi:MAG: TrmH family RNA methyltransferase [Lachnospiraceae bacterium]
MITSVSNSKIKQVVALQQSAKTRKEKELFIIEGSKLFLEARKEWILEVFILESFFKECTFLETLKNVPYEIVSKEVFKKISDTKTPQGILSVLKQPKYELTEFFKKDNPYLMVLEDLQDPGNLGTIFRTAEGAGIDGIIMSKETVDIFNPKTIRATMGSIFRVPFLYVDSLKECMNLMHTKGISTYAAHLNGAQFYDSFDYKKGTAFLIGNEGNGLKDITTKEATNLLKIPMNGELESLNAGVAAAILMYEGNRQRRQV